MSSGIKPLRWVGSSYRDLRSFPKSVRGTMGFALDQAQRGGKLQDAKPLSGFGSAGVVEIVEDDNGNTYRGVYTVKFEGVVYVLHAFQKKSSNGISTPQREIELIKSRLKSAKEDYLVRTKAK